MKKNRLLIFCLVENVCYFSFPYCNRILFLTLNSGFSDNSGCEYSKKAIRGTSQTAL